MSGTTLNVTYAWSWFVKLLWIFQKSKSTLTTAQGQFKMVNLFGKNLVDRRINR